MRSPNRQTGSIYLAALGALAFLGMVLAASGMLTSIIANSARGQQTMNTSNSLLQAAGTLAADLAQNSDPDGDGYPESTAGSVALGDGWQVPATSGAPKTDTWGSQIKYCPWDNGATNSSAGRLTGDNPASQSSVVLAVISAGPDKTFQTTCVQAKAGTVQGDDGMRVMNVSQIIQGQGVGVAVFYGPPVADMAALNLLTPANGYTPRTGEQRLVRATGQVYYWTGTAWANQVPVAGLIASASANCDTYGARAIATDSYGNLMVCQ